MYGRYNEIMGVTLKDARQVSSVFLVVETTIPKRRISVAPLTMEPKHFHKLDAWYFQQLRRVLGIKSSYYSRISNQEVWKQAGRPITPSQSVLSQQFRLLLQTMQADRLDPVHHVAFGPAYKDREAMHKNHKRGPPPP